MSRLMDIKLRRGTAAAWASANPVLDSGEPGWETDTNRLKFGDGSTAWNSLAYFAGSGAGPSSTLLSYTEKTSDTTITASAPGSADTIITAPPYTFDGATPIEIEFSCVEVSFPNSAAPYFIIGLYEDGTKLLDMWKGSNATNAGYSSGGVTQRRRFTPSAGNHTYSIRAYFTASSMTGAIRASAGGSGSGVYGPAYVRITKGVDSSVSGAAPLGSSELVYRYTVSGVDKASIDTGVDAAEAGSLDWTNGDALEISIQGRTDETGASSFVAVTFNNDTGNNYLGRTLYAPSGTPSVSTYSARANIPCAIGGASSYAGNSRLWIPNYMSTVMEKSVESVDSVPSVSQIDISTFVWFATPAAINRVAVAALTAGKKMKVGTQVSIYKRLSTGNPSPMDSRMYSYAALR